MRNEWKVGSLYNAPYEQDLYKGEDEFTPLSEILDEMNGPEEDHWQWYQSVPQLLGHEPPNQGPTQDWEFQLVDLQARGLLDKPAYKNLTDEHVVTAQKAVAGNNVPMPHPKPLTANNAPVPHSKPEAALNAPVPHPKPPKSHVQRRREQREELSTPQASDSAQSEPANNYQTPQERKDARHGNNGPVARPEGKTLTPEEKRDARHGPHRKTLTGNSGGLPINQQQAAQLESGIAQARIDLEAQSPGHIARIKRQASRGRNGLQQQIRASEGLNNTLARPIPDGTRLDDLPRARQMEFFEDLGRTLERNGLGLETLKNSVGQAKAAMVAADLGLAIVGASEGDNFAADLKRELFKLGAGAVTVGAAMAFATAVIGAPLAVTAGAALVLGAMGVAASELAGKGYDWYQNEVAQAL